MASYRGEKWKESSNKSVNINKAENVSIIEVARNKQESKKNGQKRQKNMDRRALLTNPSCCTKSQYERAIRDYKKKLKNKTFNQTSLIRSRTG